MAGRIKGITIELGANTTPLQRALSDVDRSLKNTQNKLKDIDKLLKLDPKNTELLTQKQKALKDAIGLTEDRLKQLKDAQSQVSKGTEEWDSLQREIIDTEQKLESLKKAHTDFGSVAVQKIAAVGAEMQDLGGKISDVGQKMAPLSGAAAGLVATLGGLAYGSVTAADDLNTLAKQTGFSTDTLQKMKYASDLIDVSLESMTGAVTKLKKGMSSSPEAFEALGVSVTNADGSMRDAESVFYDTLAALSKIENETERDQKAYEIFGKSADQLAGIVDDGGAALKAYGDEAEELGLIMSGDTLDSLNAVNDEVDRGKAKLSAAAGQLGATVMEGLLPLVDPLVNGIQRIVEFMQSLTPEQTNLIMTIGGVIAVLAPLLSIVGGVVSFIGTLMTALPALGAIMAAVTGPIGLIVAAVAVLAVGIATHWDEIKAATKEFIENLKAKWDEFKTKISEVWNNVKTTVSGAVAAVKEKFNAMKTTITTVAQGIYSTVKGKFDAIKNAIKNPLDTARNLVRNAINAIKGLFSGAKFEFPKIKLPHFSWDWQDIGGLVKIPKISIDWYAKGGIFTKPTVLASANGYKGVGEAGAEAVLPLNVLWDHMDHMEQAIIASNNENANAIYVAMVSAFKEMSFSIGNREFARILREHGAI